MGEGHQQDDRAWYACTAAGQLSETGAWRKSARTASELCNKALLLSVCRASTRHQTNTPGCRFSVKKRSPNKAEKINKKQNLGSDFN